MNLYTNSFRCSSRDDISEVVIDFFQEKPAFNDNDDIVGKEREPVVSLVMSAAKAALLAAMIGSTPSVTPFMDSFTPSSVEPETKLTE